MNDYVIQHGVAAQLEAPSACGCCEGTAIRTPRSVFNRPGLSRLSYRIGTHATFLESLLARIASYGVKEKAEQKLLSSTPHGLTVTDALRSTTTAGFAERGGGPAAPPKLLHELLTTREKPDFTIALFDA